MKPHFLTFGVPQVLTVDRASYFEASEFKEFAASQGMKLHFTTAYHHQSNGLVERAIRTLREQIRTGKGDWDTRLGELDMSQNISFCRAIGTTPFEAMFHRPPSTALDRRCQTRCQVRPVQSGESYRAEMQRTFGGKESPLPEVGCWVWLKTPTITAGVTRKTNPIRRGPYEVVGHLPNHKLQLKASNATFDVHADQVIQANKDNLKDLAPKLGRGRPPKGGVVNEGSQDQEFDSELFRN